MSKIVLIGAGSAIFGLGTISDIFNSKVLEGSTIMLHDINQKALKKTKSIAEEYRSKLDCNFTIEADVDRKRALKNADFCVISIEVGNRFDLWDQDWKIPLQFGFKQIYGENGGPGGLFHSLRIIPPILEICEDVRKICPDAFVSALTFAPTKGAYPSPFIVFPIDIGTPPLGNSFVLILFDMN